MEQAVELNSETIMPQQKPAGENAHELTPAKPQEYLVLASPVKNRVIMVNPFIRTPFDLKEGKSSSLGVFAVKPVDDAENLQTGERILETLPQHGRSALLVRVSLTDKQYLYRDIDVKGVGRFLPDDYHFSYVKAVVLTPERRHSGDGINGLLDKDEALLDYANSEIIHRAGVRTARALGVIELEELIVEGKKISVEQAKEQGLINKDFIPVLEIRAFGTLARIRDLLDLFHMEHLRRNKFPVADMLAYEKTSDFLLQDAKKLVAQELGKDSISNEEYLEWFAQTLGKNVGLIHRQNLLHGSLHDQNITLDCRIVDFDSITEIGDKKAFQDEFRNINIVIEDLAERVLKTTLPDKEMLRLLKEKFMFSYNSVLTKTQRKRFERMREI